MEKNELFCLCFAAELASFILETSDVFFI